MRGATRGVIKGPGRNEGDMAFPHYPIEMYAKVAGEKIVSSFCSRETDYVRISGKKSRNPTENEKEVTMTTLLCQNTLV